MENKQYKFDLLTIDEQKKIVWDKNFFINYLSCKGSPSIAEFYENYQPTINKNEGLNKLHQFLVN